MVSKTKVASLRLQLHDGVSGPAKKSTAALRELETSLNKLGKNGVPGAKNLVNQLEHLRQKSAAVGRFRELREGLRGTATDLLNARSRVRQLEDALNSATKPTAKMQADLRSARRSLEQATKAFKDQSTAARSAREALASYSLNSKTDLVQSKREIRNQRAQTIRRMRDMRRESQKLMEEQRRQAREAVQPKSHRGALPSGAGGLVAGGTVVQTGRSTVRKALEEGLSYDQAYYRRNALGGFDETASQRLNRQAERLGRDTEFSNADVVYAQTRIMQSGVRNVEQIENLTDSVTNYARALGVTLTEGAEAVTSIALIKGVDLADQKSVERLVDRQVWAAKNSGMDDSDLRQFAKYGGTPGRTAGLSDDVIMAIAMTLRRSGIRGDEGGVAARALSSKLVAPTRKGRIALQTMGLDYNDYVTNPDAFSIRGFEAGLKENFGLRLTDELRAQLADAWDEDFADPETGESIPVASDTGEFVARTREVLLSVLADLSKTDQTKAADYFRTFHRLSAGSVDAERLLDDILSTDPTLLQSNAMFTDRQGGRIAILSRNREAFLENREKMRTTPTGIAKQIGDDATKGFSGDVMRAQGSIETALTRVSQDLEVVSRPLVRAIDQTAEAFVDLPKSVRLAIEAFGAAAVAAGGYAAFQGGKNLLGNVLGSTAGGAAAGGVAGAASGGLWRSGRALLSRAIINPVTVGLATSAALAQTDPDGNLWGLTKPIDDWMKRQTGINLSNLAESDLSWLRHGPAEGTSVGASRKARQSRASSALQADVAALTASWPVAAQQAIQQYVQALATGGDQAEAEASRIGEQIKAALEVKAHPAVETGDLEHALALAQRLADLLRRLPGAAPAAGGSAVKVEGARARGGPVRGARPYLVGEDGPEIIVPRSNGTVIPNGSELGGHLTVNNHFQISIGPVGDVGDGKKVEAAVERGISQALSMLDQKLARSVQTVFSSSAYGDA